MLATDISAAILEFAAKEARAAGLANVATRTMDGERLDVDDAAFDAVISRLGLIYLPDQQGALREIRRVLRPGGRVSAVVYSTPDRNGFFALPVGIIRRRAGLPAPAPGLPGPFSLGGPGALEAAFVAAGFTPTSTCAPSLRPCGFRARPTASASSATRSAPSTRCSPVSAPRSARRSAGRCRSGSRR